MKIVKAANGYHYLSYFDNRRTRLVSLKTKDVDEAHRRAVGKLDAVQDRRLRESIACVSQVLGYYRQHRGAKISGRETLDRTIKHLNKSLGHLKPMELRPPVIEAYVKGRGVKPGTTRRELGVLIAALNFASKRQIIPPASFPAIELPPASPPKELWCTLDQLDTLLETAAARRMASLQPNRLSRLERWLWLAIETGARLQAIIELRWDSVDFSSGLIDYSNGQPGNSYKRRATVPISDRLLPVLRRAHQERKFPLVLDYAGSIKTSFNNMKREAGLDWVTPHTLRHSWASNAVMAGVSFVEVARVLGNSSAVVEKTYAKFAPGYLRSAVNFRQR